MKLLIALFTIFTAIQANANTTTSDIQTGLIVQQIDQLSPLYNYDIQSGHITYNDLEKSLTLVLQPSMPSCSGGLMCVQMMPAPIEIKMENVKNLTDRCGIVTYTGSIDDTDVDGLIETLVLIDNTENVCPTLVALPQYLVQYNTFSLRTEVSTSASFISFDLKLKASDTVVLPVQPLESI